MTKAAFVAASRLCRKLAVLASSERLDFHHPVRVGAIVEAIARVVATGRSSMTVGFSFQWARPQMRNLNVRKRCTIL
ncbi:hotdog domain-containing protein [Rhizobium sp. YS-1r]|uniref:Hotdog domain-containing protein n=1 Tax=Neorhizobium phenanthreniclasticum TaxID=3157917 RepID=A0ABV0M606_9HYPH|nr:hotdog domain-containing protein [Rhizobium sp. YS-1r]